MGNFSTGEWNLATVIVACYGFGLILVSAGAQALLLAKTDRQNPFGGGGNKSRALMSLGFASWSRRFLALLIDVVVLVAVSALPAIAVHPVVGAVVLCLSASVYFPWGYGAGYTLGTLFTRIRIVNSRGLAPGLARGAVRYLMFFSIISHGEPQPHGIPLSGGVLFYPATMQGGHDRFAGTFVVHKHQRPIPRP